MSVTSSDVQDLIGKTPLYYLKKLPNGTGATIAAKLEAYQPGSSVKDRMAKFMIDDAEEKGLITPGKTTLIEATSGNLGIALAFLAAAKGYKFIAVMPEYYSLERRVIIKSLGGQVVLTEAKKGVDGAVEKLNELLELIPDSHQLNQFANPANPDGHYKTTGPEIWEATGGKIDIFIAGVGSGGTVTGVGRFLKEKNPEIKVIAVEPAESPVISGGEHTPYNLIQGMGAGFVPPVLDVDLLDEVVVVPSKEALETARRIAIEEGLLVGTSSGATAAAALKVASRPENQGKVIVTVFASQAERYLSTKLFEELYTASVEQQFEPYPRPEGYVAA